MFTGRGYLIPVVMSSLTNAAPGSCFYIDPSSGMPMNPPCEAADESGLTVATAMAHFLVNAPPSPNFLISGGPITPVGALPRFHGRCPLSSTLPEDAPFRHTCRRPHREPATKVDYPSVDDRHSSAVATPPQMGSARDGLDVFSGPPKSLERPTVMRPGHRDKQQLLPALAVQSRSSYNGTKYHLGGWYVGHVKRYNPLRGFGFLTAAYQLVPVGTAAEEMERVPTPLDLTTATSAANRLFDQSDHNCLPTAAPWAYFRVQPNVGDIFVHQSNVGMEGFRFLPVGGRVLFQVGCLSGLTTFQATSVSLLSQRASHDGSQEVRNTVHPAATAAHRRHLSDTGSTPPSTTRRAHHCSSIKRHHSNGGGRINRHLSARSHRTEWATQTADYPSLGRASSREFSNCVVDLSSWLAPSEGCDNDCSPNANVKADHLLTGALLGKLSTYLQVALSSATEN